MESLKGPIEIPWAITLLATHPTRKTYVDVTNDLPSNEQFVAALQHPTMHCRYTTKRKGSVESQTPGESHRSRTEGLDMDLTAEKAVSSSLPDMIPGAEITIDLPDSKRGIQKFIDNPEAFVVSQLLTWKSLQDGTQGTKAKARAIILGDQDKSYEYKQTASPTLSRVGRQACLMF